jgi:RND family efflux transporter MFP subunit
MRRVTNWVLLVLAIAALVLGLLAQRGVLQTPAPPIAFGAAAAVFVALLAIRSLPLNIRRPVVFLVTLALIGGLAAGLAYFQFVMKPAMTKQFMATAFAPKPTSVSVEAAKLERWPPQLLAIGTLRAYQGIVIAPQAAGVVEALHFESGDDVKAGDLLISIDDSVEQADLESGLAQLKNAEATLARQKALVAGGNTPQSTLDSALAARDTAAAAVERTRAVIAQKTIRAPFSGRLGLRTSDLGQYASVGMTLATLQQLDPIYADFQAPEDALATLAVGQEVGMTVDALPGVKFQGKVKAIDARVSAESRNVTARAQFDNPDRRLLPGMFANVTVSTGAPKEVLTVPRTAIVYSLYGDNVFVLEPAKDKEGQKDAGGFVVDRRFVKLGAVRGERIAVTEGLKEGEQVVTSGQVKLQPNFPVTIDQTAALPSPAERPRP